ncbi:MAG TPA: hypothetical protein VFZ32_02375 [Micromonosporaceae bacterium]
MFKDARRLSRQTLLITVGLAVLATVMGPTVGAAAAEPSASAKTHSSKKTGCDVVKPRLDGYEAGRVSTELLTVPSNPNCTTIAVRNIKDPGNPGDHCATFLIQFPQSDGEAIYTDPVTACSRGPHGPVTILATNVPDGTDYRVIYDIDYLIQGLKFWILH